MSNDDCSAKCPKCGHSVNLRMQYGFPDTYKIKEMSVYCPIQSCGYEDKWIWNEKGNYLKKQTEPPKICEKIFKITYVCPKSEDRAKNWLDCMSLKEILDKTASKDYKISTKVEEYDPSVWETTKIPEKIIKERCNTCLHYDYCSIEESKRCIKNYFIAWRSMAMEKTEDHGNDELQASGDYEAMMDIAKQAIKNSKDPEMFKDIELKLDFTKSCSNCGWDINNHCENSIHCDKDYSEWKPKKEENKEKQAWKGEIPPTYPNEKRRFLKMAKNKTKKKKEFRVRISNCGTSYANRSYEKMSGKCALEVCKRALVIMISDMVGKDNINQGLYLMSLYFLKELHKHFDEKFPELKKDNFDDYLKIFEFKD